METSNKQIMPFFKKINKQRESRLKNSKIHSDKVNPLVFHYRKNGRTYKDMALQLNLLGYRNQDGKLYQIESVRRLFIRI